MRNQLLPKTDEKSKAINQFYLENFQELYSYADAHKHSRKKSMELVTATYWNVINSNSEIENISAYSWNILKRLCVSNFTGFRKVNTDIDNYSLKQMFDYFDVNQPALTSEISDLDCIAILEEIKTRFSQIEFETFFLYMNGLQTEDISELTGRSEKSIYTAKKRYSKKLDVVKKLIRKRFFE